MSFKFLDWYSGLVGLGTSILLSSFVILGSTLYPEGVLSTGLAGSLFCFDSVSFYLTLLSLLLMVSLWFWGGAMSGLTRVLVAVSGVFSVLCYCCSHVLLFWVFYEMSIVPLLVLLIVESPYSERYVASWYLLGYVVLTSLPMLLCLLFMSMEMGGLSMRFWCSGEYGGSWVICVFVLAVLFITKIPLPPFHVWLPIVHAEASSPVSVCLSGYIMKLGVLGVCRLCFYVLPSDVFTLLYALVCFLVSVLFFLAATRELDGKRWLAFLSLSHIVVVCGCLSVGSWSLGPVSFVYCLGHGLSAGLTFLFLWGIYDMFSTRNLFLLKGGMSSSLLLRVVGCSVLCTVCSFPPTVQFFSEIALVAEATGIGLVVLGVLYIFVFLGGLVPLFLVGLLLTRHCDVSFRSGGEAVKVFSLVFLLVWSYGLFLVC